ncbi:MAG: hypothetical protein KDK65_00595, partial [Chlamydiia bacterium]|nr:hypothetical protein [Chlamydiia bacterium]
MNMLMLAADLPTFLPAGEMDWRGWVTIGVFCVTFFALVKEIRPPDIVMFISSSVLVVLGILTPSEFLDGFSQDILLTIAMLCIVVRAMEVNGLLEILTRRLLTDSSSYFKQMGSLLFPVGVSSAFLNNTPIVLMMAPVVRRWALKLKVSPSKFLLPMSYIAVLGGVCTIMGTSTNLIIEGLVRKQSPESVIGFFEIAWVGLPIFVVGSIYLFMIGRLIPARLDPISAIEEETREFTSEFIIEEGCPLAKTRIREISGRYFS